jgi:hypothetical protein
MLVRFRVAIRYLCLVFNKPPGASTAPAAAAFLLCWSVVIAVI